MNGYLMRMITTGLFLVIFIFSWSCRGKQQTPPPTNTNSDTSPSTKPGPPRYEGYIDIANCDVIHGWLWDRDRPNVPMKIEIIEGTKVLATMDANELRENLVEAGKGDGRHAYTYFVPAYLKDSKPHSIQVRIVGGAFEVGNSPTVINCTFNDKK